MDTSSGITLARVADLVTRRHTIPLAGFQAPMVLAIVLAMGVGVHATAQEEILPEPSIMAPLASRTLALDAAAVEGKLVAVGERGHILISTDNGATWQQAQVPTRAMLTGVDFFDENLGWAVGHDSAILRTSDGGATWELVNWAPEEEAPFFDVWFRDAENGVAIGAYGAYYATADGGTTWDFVSVDDTDWHLHKIARADDGRLFIAAEAGYAYRSDDGGETWEELPSDYEGSYFGVLPLEGDSVLIFGLRGNLFRSDDAGESWEEIETGTVSMLTDGLRLGDGSIIITGLGGAVLVSMDGGRSFELHQQANRRGISSIVDAGDGSLLMTGEFGVTMTTLADLMTAAD
jgi:photosystem II stability/assembly factor-like uncharacterized protein